MFELTLASNLAPSELVSHGECKQAVSASVAFLALNIYGIQASALLNTVVAHFNCGRSLY